MEGKFTRSQGVNKYACACAIIASSIAILMGYDTGVMSGAMLFIKEDLKTTDGQLQVLAGILNVFALVGSLTAGRLSDMIGRRYTIVVASAIFFVGSALMGLGLNFAMLFCGRCVAGIGVGYALMIAPVYSAEISTASSRGSLSSLPDMCISLGILLGYVANYLLAELPLQYGWRLMLGIGAVPSFFLMFAILGMPESPRWLVMQGRVEEAKEVLLKVSNTSEEAELRLNEIKFVAGISDEDESRAYNSGAGVWKELLVHPTPSTRRILTAAMGLHCLQHMTGIEAVVLYSPRIFEKAGIKSKNHLLLATVAVGFTKTVFILVAVMLIDRVGRRSLLLSSMTGMILSLLGLGVALTMVDHSEEKLMWTVVLCVTCVLSFMASFSSGVGPATWVYSSEIFPLRLRAQGASLGVAVNRMMNAAMSMSFISIYKAITVGGTFFLFAGFGVAAWLFYFFFCPETNGRSLEEIEEVFSKKGDKIQPRKETIETDGSRIQS